MIAVTALVTGLTAQGCVYIPPVWDLGDAIKKVDQIEVGKTTRGEVLDLLGDPDSGDGENAEVFRYHGTYSDGFIMFGYSYSAYVGLMGDEDWFVDVAFDENGVVRWVNSSNDSEAKKEQRLQARADQLQARADQGDAEAQYELAVSALTDEEMLRWQRLLSEKAQRGDSPAQYWLSKYYYSRDKIEDFVRWRCYAANQEYPEAQFSIGRSYQYGDETTERDPILAYMWWALSEASSDRLLRSAYREALAKSMSPTQIAEAERLVAEWKPDPSACEVEAASSS